jgi:hypothetical protein
VLKRLPFVHKGMFTARRFPLILFFNYFHMRLLFLAVVLLSCHAAFAQCQTYKLTRTGDTINCLDKNNLKQGKWVVHVDPLRGNPGYDEEGEFLNDNKEGIWRKYSTMGDLLAIESYKWGKKNGVSQYYTIAGLEREESWLAMDPKKKYDTIDVPRLDDPNTYDQVVVENSGKSYKHGSWKWYRPGSNTLVRNEIYVLNKLQEPEVKPEDAAASDSTAAAKKEEQKKVKPKEVADYEKKNSGKTRKVRDGRVGY